MSALEGTESCYDEVGPESASFLIEQILETAEQLENFLRMGRLVPEIDEEAVRELLYENYRVIYVVDPDDTRRTPTCRPLVTATSIPELRQRLIAFILITPVRNLFPSPVSTK